MGLTYYLCLSLSYLLSYSDIYPTNSKKRKGRVGINIIIKTEERMGDLQCDGAIIIANRFSSTASEMVEHISKHCSSKIILFKQKEVDQMLASS